MIYIVNTYLCCNIRADYEALTEAQKAQVKKLAILVEAERDFWNYDYDADVRCPITMEEM